MIELFKAHQKVRLSKWALSMDFIVNPSRGFDICCPQAYFYSNGKTLTFETFTTSEVFHD